MCTADETMFDTSREDFPETYNGNLLLNELGEAC